MAILKMKKFDLIYFKNHLDNILNELQKFKEVDFRKIEVEEYDNVSSNNKEDIHDHIYKLENTLKRIRKYAIAKGSIENLRLGQKSFTYEQLEEYTNEHNYSLLLDNINELFKEQEMIKKDIENNNNLISEYKNWKEINFTNDNINHLKQVKVIIGGINKKYMDQFISEIDLMENIYLHRLGETKKEFLFYSINLNEDIALYNEILKKYNFNELNLELSEEPKDIISRLLKENEQKNESLLYIDGELRKKAEEIETLEIVYEYYKNRGLKEEASEHFLETDKLNIISGYIPQDKEKEFIKHIENVCDKDYYLSFQEIDEEDKDIPIKLSNNKFIKPFESLTATYSMPRYTEVDPTPYLAPFFALFFGMMVADVGYGLLMLVVSGLVLLTCNLKEDMKNMIKFFLILSIFVIFIGFLYGSYFGLSIPGMWRLVDPAKDYNDILMTSIVIGVVHVFFGLFVKAIVLFKSKKYIDILYDVVFWVLLLSSIGIFLGASTIGISESMKNIAKYTMIASMIGIIATGGREVKNVGGRIGLGVYALYGISGYMGDLISYARLMALGLSGGFIAVSVNMIAGMLMGSWKVIIFAAIIFVIGHLFNMLLSLLSAYVHSSRLIYVEFFSKFYTGGGVPFKDFKIKEKYITIINK